VRFGHYLRNQWDRVGAGLCVIGGAIALFPDPLGVSGTLAWRNDGRCRPSARQDTNTATHPANIRPWTVWKSGERHSMTRSRTSLRATSSTGNSNRAGP
jgi:hypothetical protein